MSRRKVVIAGSTGSIGSQGLDVIRSCPDRFELVGVGANSSVKEVVAQAQEFNLKHVAIGDASRAEELRDQLPDDVEVTSGPGAMEQLVAEADCDVVLNAVVGFAGLGVTLATLQSNKLLALANKESLVAAGDLVKATLAKSAGQMIPVDSEHGALHQCLRAETAAGAGDGSRVSKLLLTASGGPFRGKTLPELETVTAQEALAHPSWVMGPKITVDSSTLFNKGLEVIEAHVLFDIDYDHIEVVVHPQSVLHSAVVFADGSVIGQMSNPDMRLPIGYALGYPERIGAAFGSIDWTQLSQLTFEAPDPKTFRCLDLAFAAGRAGGVAPLWLNAANEVAVGAFLGGHIRWIQIAEVIEETLACAPTANQGSLEEVVAQDSEARRLANGIVERL